MSPPADAQPAGSPGPDAASVAASPAEHAAREGDAPASPASEAPAEHAAHEGDPPASPASDAPAEHAAREGDGPARTAASDAPATSTEHAAREGDAPVAADTRSAHGAHDNGGLPTGLIADADLPPLPASFDELPLPDALRRAIARLGWTKPSPVQALSYDPLVAGRDVLVQSHTGSGKTGAFCVPWLASRFDPRPARETGVQLLVLLPTRELAKQVCDELRRLALETPVDVLPVYGGTPMNPQLTALRAGVHAVVGTPGRILDHIRRRSLDLSKVTTVVLDECDEMLSMGFLEDIRAILDQITGKHQTALFSATIPSDVDRIARRYMTEPQSVQLSGDQVAAAEIEHAYYLVNSAIKTRDLFDLIMVEDPARAIIFCNTREETKLVASVLRREGFHAEELSSDLNQTQRERVMKAMREHKIRFLVATDVAARGIDISHVTHVINYSFPESAEVYVHRTGRTGRAGRTGTALSLVSPREIGNFYYLKLQYPSITFSERSLPPAEQLAAERMEYKLDGISKRFPELVSPEWVLLARSLMADPRGERVVALLLERGMRQAPRVEPILDFEAENAAAAAADSGEAPVEGAVEARPTGPGEVIERESRDLREPREPRELRGDREYRGDRDRGGRGDRRDRRDRRDRPPREHGELRGPRDGDAPREFRARDDRPARDDAPREFRGRDDRPPRGEDGPREFRGRDERPARDDAPREFRGRDDRPARDDAPREFRGRDDRPAREGDAQPREFRSRDDRPAREGDAQPREFEGRRRRDRRDRRDRDDRGPRPDRPRQDAPRPADAAPAPAGLTPAPAPEVIEATPAGTAPVAQPTLPAPGALRFDQRGRKGDRGSFFTRLTDPTAVPADTVAAAAPALTGADGEAATAVAGELEGGEGRRRRRRKRRRGRRDDAEQQTTPGEAAPIEAELESGDGTDAEADDADSEADDTTPGSAADGEPGGEGRRRRRRRRRGRDGLAEARPAAASPPPPAPAIVPVPPPRRVSQDEIVIDIDENELAVVSDEFGEIEDEFDEFALMDRRQAVIETLQEEVELEDVSGRDAVAVVADEETDDEEDDDEPEAEASAESESGEASEPAAPGAEAEAAGSDEGARKRKRRRRRKKAAPLVTPELTAPPHKDFWEVWAGKYTYHDFEDDKFVSPNPVPEVEEEPVPADRPAAAARPERRPEPPRSERRPERPRRPAEQPPVERRPVVTRPAVEGDEGEYIKVALNLGRTHGHKAATIRGLLRDQLGLEGRAVRDLTVRDADTLLRIPAGELPRVQSDLQGVREGDVALTLVPAEEEAHDLRAPQPEDAAGLVALAADAVAADAEPEQPAPALADDPGTT
ncbi:MAG: DEAD/DEAH box helicase [Myxococcales bacterium]|nr:DEAD/DEAH box helicase [Myxococcales bacterium]